MKSAKVVWDPVEPRMECRVCGAHVIWRDGRKHCGTCGRDRVDMELRQAATGPRRCHCGARIIYRMGHYWCPTCGWDPKGARHERV